MKKPKFKFTVKHLASRLNLEPVSVRVRLRNARIKKYKDRFYGWDDETQFNRVLEKIS
jgi:hypothetical protein